MKRAYILLLLLLSLALQAVAQVDRDSRLLAAAAAELAKDNCSKALTALQQVSIDGKDGLRYMKLMGEMHECKKNRVEAVFFYKKYMALQPNDTIQARIDVLEKAIDKNGDRTKTNFKSTNYRYNIITAGRIAVTGSKTQASYSGGWLLSAVHGYPAFHRKATLEFGAEIGLLSNPNKEWFAAKLNTSMAGVESIGSGIMPGLNISLLVILYKNKQLSVGAGPTAGFDYLSTPNYQISGGAINIGNLGWSTLKGGIIARLYYKHMLTAYAGYNKLFRQSLDVEYGYMDKHASHINMSMITIGVGVYTWFDN